MKKYEIFFRYIGAASILILPALFWIIIGLTDGDEDWLTQYLEKRQD